MGTFADQAGAVANGDFADLAAWRSARDSPEKCVKSSVDVHDKIAVNARHILETRLLETWPPQNWRGTVLLVAVSGGADSVALLSALARQVATTEPAEETRLVGCHFNHGLRGIESDGDEQFVRELCRGLNVACETGRTPANAFRATGGAGVETQARSLRYEFLREAARRWQAAFVVTAHTKNDQAETVLHRILRGTGLAGLTGIPFCRPLDKGVQLVRPLLCVSREQVLDYLSLMEQDYRHDSSNDDSRFTRNRLRHELLPELRRCYNEKVDESLVRLSQLAAEAQQVIQREVDRLRRAVQVDEHGTVRLDCRRLAGQPPHLLRELCIAVWQQQQWPLQSMGQREWHVLEAFISSGHDRHSSKKQMLPGGITATKKGGQLSLTRP